MDKQHCLKTDGRYPSLGAINGRDDAHLAAIFDFLAPAKPTWTSPEAVKNRRILAHVRCAAGSDLAASCDSRSEIKLHSMERVQSPVFVSYYTVNTPYESLASNLARTLDAFGLDHDIRGLPSRGSWVANTGMKSQFIREAWHRTDRPICWLDADSELIRKPNILFDNPFDVAFVRRLGWYDLAGLIYFNRSEQARRIIEYWVNLCTDHLNIWDQALFTIAWHKAVREYGASSLWLTDAIFRFPRPWIRDIRDQIFYYPTGKKLRPLFNQKQASRSLKAFVNAGLRSNEIGSDAISPAFRKALSKIEFGSDFDVYTAFEIPRNFL